LDKKKTVEIPVRIDFANGALDRYEGAAIEW
jgi:hypothetical protein